MDSTKCSLLAPENARNALKIINTVHPEWGIHTFHYQGKPVSNKKDKYVHTYGPSYDIQVLYERNFKQWAVVSFATQEHLTTFKQFKASKRTRTLEQYLKHIDAECEAGQFKEVETTYTYEYCDKIFVIYQIKDDKRGSISRYKKQTAALHLSLEMPKPLNIMTLKCWNG